MRKFSILFLSALMVMVMTTFAACGMGKTNDDIHNEIDDIGDDIKDGIDNVEEGIQNGIDDMEKRKTRTSRLEEAGKNLVESVREASVAIRDGLIELSQMR